MSTPNSQQVYNQYNGRSPYFSSPKNLNNQPNSNNNNNNHRYQYPTSPMDANSSDQSQFIDYNNVNPSNMQPMDADFPIKYHSELQNAQLEIEYHLVKEDNFLENPRFDLLINSEPSSDAYGSNLTSRPANVQQNHFPHFYQQPQIPQEEFPIFRKSGHLPLPQALLQQFESLECSCFMGQFPEISRAWLTIDNKIFLWNYEDGGDFVFFDGLEQMIICAAVVVPRPNVFIDSVSHLLVLATPVEIILLTISWRKLGNYNAINILPSGLSIPSDNVNMLKIIGTKHGRIFCAGKDGHLYEILYQAEDTFFQKKIRKINRSASVLAQWLPSFLNVLAEDPLIDIAVDETRNILYTLSEGASAISVYDLGQGGDVISHVTFKKEIEKEAERLCPRSKTWHPKIIAIQAIPTTESNTVHLVAITKTGYRLYFTTDKSFRSHPMTLELLHVRVPPHADSLSHEQQNSQYHAAFYAQGVCLMAKLDELHESDQLVAVQPEWHLQSSERSFWESLTPLQIFGKTWAIAEQPYPEFAARWITLLGPQAMRSELTTQIFLPPRKFLILTNKGVQMVAKLRPVDVLFELLVRSGAKPAHELKNFFAAYGCDVACAMCLIIICQNSEAFFKILPEDTKPKFYTPPTTSVITAAIEAFFTKGGRPEIVQEFGDSGQMPVGPNQFYMSSTNNGNSNANNSANNHTPNNISMRDTGYYRQPTRFQQQHSRGFQQSQNTPGPAQIRFSDAHNGVCLFLSQLLRPFWRESILASKKKPNQQPRLLFDKDLLLALADQLSLLKAFLDRFPNFTSSNDPTRSKKDEPAHLRERQSIYNVRLFIARCIEAAHFLSVMADHDMPRIYALTAPSVQSAVELLTFRDLIVTENGSAVGRELINSLMNLYNTDGLPVDEICQVLKSRCPGYFSEQDRLLFKGIELINCAQSVQDYEERLPLLQESLEIFQQVPGRINMDEVCTEYQKLYFYVGIVKLALDFAKAIDPSNLASFCLTNQPATDIAKKLLEERKFAYDFVLRVFAELRASEVPDLDVQTYGQLRKQTIMAAKSANDELFHFYLYSWFLQENLESELLDVQWPYLEKFLKNPEHYHLLWQYYVRYRKWDQAAQILIQLAQTSDKLTLMARIENLAKAKSCLSNTNYQSQPQSGSALHDLEEIIEVAKIQLKVYNEIAQLGEAHFISSIESQSDTLKQLDAGLMNLSDLFNKFAQKHKLYDSQLAILHCAGGSSFQKVAEQVWKAIIKQTGAVSSLQNRVRKLGTDFYPSELVFPLPFLVNELELFTWARPNEPDQTPNWVIEVLHQIGVPFPTLFEIYYDLCMTDSQSGWAKNPEKNLYILKSLCYLLIIWNPKIFSLSLQQNIQAVVKQLDSLAMQEGNEEISALSTKVKQILWK